MSQLKVHNEDTGEWFEMGAGLNCPQTLEKLFPHPKGTGTCIVQADYDYPLTPIDPPIWAKLGKELLESVPEPKRSRVTAYRRPTEVEQHVNSYGEIHDGKREGCRIILAPVLAPEPAPKADLELMQESLDTLYRLRGSATGDADPMITKLQARLNCRSPER